ncbi:D-glucuronyl C5-epimerase family protein [Marinobacter sp. F4206]|uniref:D-glucuronyl C5-epimerase family protein n=1 Tax=Marinobacter sp. F4206 TaxID=2861777 RepID=UPI001C5DF039|nr:D-glucuronyl C5-epimerase family protein [Marinobacter sp. F4206]MBW4933782.1 D-glucuronyl C5-epimerase family protein [Marinobacter sp. F4206]
MVAATVNLDDKGIPLSDYGKREGELVGHQRSIVAVADKGLDYWNKENPSQSPVLLSYSWSEGRDLRTSNGSEPQVSNLEGMINCADWLVENAVTQADAVLWKYNYPFKNKMSAGWRSGHAQGQAILLLIRAFDATGDRKYLQVADGAVRGYCIQTEEGGFTEKLSDDSWWYLKFASEGGEKPFVLNGMLFALLGLHEYSHRFNSQLADDLLDKGLSAVEAMLPRFDMGNWSAYNIFGKPCSKHYHQIQCVQLEQLFTPDCPPVVREILDRWKESDTSGATAGMYEMGSGKKSDVAGPETIERPVASVNRGFKAKLKARLKSVLGK